MFQSLAKLVTGHPWRVLAVVGIVAIASSVISSGLADRLSTQGFDNPGSESSQALDRISSATNVDPSGEVIALIRVKGNVDPDGRQLAALATRKIGDDPDIARVLTPFDGERVNRELISRDGRSAVVVGYVKPGHDESGVQDR
ncbi:MAG TPA: hypothetical protein VGO97_03780, partial [Solirubrobacterales bacterium]|nr:hypothetical protein [Solirubrobacterales bacterium]